MAFGKLPIEPSVEAGNSFMFSLKARLRDIAKALNPIADFLARQRADNGSTYTQIILDGPASGGGAYFALNKIEPLPNREAAIDGMRNNVLRWRVVLGDSVTESGSNAGSNFRIQRWSDAGAYLGTPLTIDRASGIAVFESEIEGQQSALISGTSASLASTNPVTMANTAIVTLNMSGILLITETVVNGVSGAFILGGGNVELIGGLASFYSITAGTAGHINVFYNGAGGYSVQNLQGAARTVNIMFFKTRNVA